MEGLACVLGGSLGHSQCHFPGDCASKVFLQIVSSGKGQELAPILGEADRLIQKALRERGGAVPVPYSVDCQSNSVRDSLLLWQLCPKKQ